MATVRLNLKRNKGVAAILLLIAIAGLVNACGAMIIEPKCDTVVMGLLRLLPCKSAVDPSIAAFPLRSCCSAIEAAGLDCLCLVVNGPPFPGVDRGLAMKLPVKCNLTFPPCRG